jgi:hypothetical protein
MAQELPKMVMSAADDFLGHSDVEGLPSLSGTVIERALTADFAGIKSIHQTKERGRKAGGSHKMHTIAQRRDHTEDPGNQFVALWGLRLPEGKTEFCEYLLSVYDLTARDGDEPVRHLPEATHEIVVFALSPEVEIDFTQSLLGQPALRPVTPMNRCYQVVAGGDADALELVQACADRILAGTLNPDQEAEAGWVAILPPGAFDVTRPFPRMERSAD